MILSKRPKDDDSVDGFTKWPFMTTHTWGENPRGKWTLEVKFESDTPQTGYIKEWTLMVHGAKDPPYKDLTVHDANSKLAIVKKAHEMAFAQWPVNYDYTNKQKNETTVKFDPFLVDM